MVTVHTLFEKTTAMRAIVVIAKIPRRIMRVSTLWSASQQVTAGEKSKPSDEKASVIPNCFGLKPLASRRTRAAIGLKLPRTPKVIKNWTLIGRGEDIGPGFSRPDRMLPHCGWSD